jgi:mono/diheme cytochrome c family protein
MSRSRRHALTATLLCAVAAGAGACGSEGIEVASDSPDHPGAVLFAERCSGCHTFSAAGTEGSASNVATRERKDGPNFDQRQESVEDVLFAIQNGGFSSGPMPQNIATGEEAQQIAEFVAKYSGQGADRPPTP